MRPPGCWCLPGYGDDLERQDPGIRERHADASAPPGFTDAVGWMARLDDAPAVDAPAWTVTFAVGDVDDVVRRAGELRVAVELPPMTADEVRFAVLRDPWSASFTVSQYSARADGPSSTRREDQGPRTARQLTQRHLGARTVAP